MTLRTRILPGAVAAALAFAAIPAFAADSDVDEGHPPAVMTDDAGGSVSLNDSDVIEDAGPGGGRVSEHSGLPRHVIEALNIG